MRTTRYLTPVLFGLLMAGAAHAQGTPAAQADKATETATAVAEHTDPGVLSGSDKSSLIDVAKGANYELAIAKLAEQRASHPDVKQYAKTVTADHEQLNGALHQIAQRGGVTLPPGMTHEEHGTLTHLETLHGAAFDKAYVGELKRINGKDSSAMKKEIDTTKNTAVKAFLKQMQTADDKHEEMAKKLEGYS